MSTETGPLLWSTANHKVGIFTFEHSCHKPPGVSKLKPRRFHGVHPPHILITHYLSGLTMAMAHSAEENAQLLSDIKKSFGRDPNAVKYSHENYVCNFIKLISGPLLPYFQFLSLTAGSNL